MEAKICGVKDINTLKYIINHKYPPKFIGFIINYKKSKRYVKIEKLKELISIKRNKVFIFVVVTINCNKIHWHNLKSFNFSNGADVISSFSKTIFPI